MRMSEKNIKFVRRMEKDGVTYSYFVSMRRNWVSDCRLYINYENGVTVAKEYEFSRLPVSVQKFLRSHDEVLLDELCGVKEYICK